MGNAETERQKRKRKRKRERERYSKWLMGRLDAKLGMAMDDHLSEAGDR